MDIEQALLEIVGHTYETAEDDTHWQLVTEGICRLLNASGARLLLVDKHHRYGPLILGGNPQANYQPYINRINEDPWRQTALNQGYTAGEIGFGRDLVSEKELLRTDFYYDLLKPADYHHAMGGTLADNDEHHVSFSVNRSAKQQDFSEHDRRLINKLAPHLKRAILLRHQLQSTREQAATLKSSLNVLSAAVTIVDANGRVCYFNEKMHNILEAQHELQIREQKIWLKSIPQRQQLNQFINQAAAIFQGTYTDDLDGRSSLALTLNGERYHLLVLPLGSSVGSRLTGGFTQTQGCVALSLTAQTTSQAVSKTILADLYQLTVREIHLCDALMADLSLNQAAEKIGITPSTARSYLKNIFHKVGVQSQSSLILRLSKLSGLR